MSTAFTESLREHVGNEVDDSPVQHWEEQCLWMNFKGVQMLMVQVLGLGTHKPW